MSSLNVCHSVLKFSTIASTKTWTKITRIRLFVYNYKSVTYMIGVIFCLKSLDCQKHTWLLNYQLTDRILHRLVTGLIRAWISSVQYPQRLLPGRCRPLLALPVLVACPPLSTRCEDVIISLFSAAKSR